MIDYSLEIHKLLTTDVQTKRVFKDRVWLMEYPDVETIKEPYIVISELMEPESLTHGDDITINHIHLLQVDIFIPSSDEYNGYHLCRDMSVYINQLIKDKLKLGNIANSKPEYDSDYKIYRRVRRYEGIS